MPPLVSLVFFLHFSSIVQGMKILLRGATSPQLKVYTWLLVVSGVLTLSHAVLMLGVSRRPSYFIYFAKTLHVSPQRCVLDIQIPYKASPWTLQLF